jgi:hypothetical protein
MEKMSIGVLLDDQGSWKVDLVRHDIIVYFLWRTLLCLSLFA